MAWVTESRSNVEVQTWIQQIVSEGCLSRYEHLHLTSIILADYKLADEERRQISRVLDYVQIGRLRLLD